MLTRKNFTIVWRRAVNDLRATFRHFGHFATAQLLPHTLARALSEVLGDIVSLVRTVLSPSDASCLAVGLNVEAIAIAAAT